MEMHLVSRTAQTVCLDGAGFDESNFAAGETIHTENSYKYRPGQAEAMLAEAGFTRSATWTDERMVCGVPGDGQSSPEFK